MAFRTAYLAKVNSMQNPVYRVVYVSSAAGLFDKPALLDLLNKARENNRKLDVTGMLLYRDGDFIQLLEGERATVEALYRTIAGDPRHTGATLILEEYATERLFSDWSMGFRDLSNPDVQSTPGFSQFMNSRHVADGFGDDPAASLELLRLFQPRF